MLPEDRKVIQALAFSIASLATAIFVSLFKLSWVDPVGSILTIVAAFIGGYFITRQIRSSEKQQAKERNAKYLAARAAMPLTLSAVSTYATRCADILREVYEARTGMTLHAIPGLPEIPSFPSEAIHEFRTLIEYGPTKIAGPIASLLGLIQVQRARIEQVGAWNSGRPASGVDVWNVEQYIINTAEIYMRGGYLYEYARFEADQPRAIDINAIRSGLRQLNFDESEGLIKRTESWRPRYEKDLDLSDPTGSA